MLKLAQLGAGYWGPNLVRNFVQLSEVSEFLVCDVDRNRLERIRRLHPGIKLAGSEDELLNDPEIDAVVIAIPAALHYEYARRALIAGKHVLVEKPLALKKEEAEDLVRLAEENKRVLMVGHVFLYNAAVRKVKEYIESGQLGDIYYIMSQRLSLGQVRQDVNVMWNLAPHDVSIILYCLNETPCRVTAKGLTFLQNGIEDVVFMNLEFPSGRAAHIHVSWLDPSKTRKTVVVGSQKMLVYDDVAPDAKIIIYDKGIDKKNIMRPLPEVEDFGQFQLYQRIGDIHIPKIEFEEPLRVECRHFVNCIIDGSKPLTDGRHGLQVVDVLVQAQASLKAGSK
ncbi:MAG: Gfo/Idh/MocA family oxidoreductase [Thermodesulfobacteriota bacterium]